MAPPSWRKIAEVVVRVDLLVMQSMVPRWQRPSHAKSPRCEHKLHKLLANSSNMSGRAVLRQNISRIHHALAYLGLFDLIHSYPFLSSLDSCCTMLCQAVSWIACVCMFLPSFAHLPDLELGQSRAIAGRGWHETWEFKWILLESKQYTTHANKR
jgi:hypothetical protein